MFLYSVISIFRLWIILFNSFSCLVVFSCSSSSDFCISSLRASTCLPVFSGILRELFMSFLSPYACSLHLFVSSATYHRCLNEACPSCDPGCVRNPQSLAISVVLWFCDPVILRSWVCEKPWDSSCFCNPEILLWPSSWDAMILGVLQHLWVKLILDALGPGVELAPKVYTGQLTLEGTCATSQAGVSEFLDPIGPSYSWCWDRCCILLTPDPMILEC